MREGLWESCGPKSSDTHNFAVCHYDDRIMAAGGITELFEDEFTYHTSCEVLETRTNSWRFVGELPVALGSSKCCQVDNIVQLFGGVNDDDDSDSVFIFDTSAETWTLSESVMIDQFTILSLNLI
uniref:F-box/kelch-repeat protein n=1 Tax=Rhabditophanes sp. KR3021 TaxID=114890 RepID=A0AC35U3T6_9BILA